MANTDDWLRYFLKKSLFSFRWSRVQPLGNFFNLNSDIIVVSEHWIQVHFRKDEHVYVSDCANRQFVRTGVN